MNIFRELLAKLHIAREHMTSEYRLQKRLDALEDKLLFLMDNSLDITKIKPATGVLRIVQQICLQMLRIVDAIARRNGVPYWLCYGTLLGAVRHGGFVPWDNDVDICFMHDDFDRFIEILRKELPQRFEVIDWQSEKTGEIIGIARVIDSICGYYVDMYPFERVPGAISTLGNATDFELAFQRKYESVVYRAWTYGLSNQMLSEINLWHQENNHGDGDMDGIVTSMRYASASMIYRQVFRVDDVFPLGKAIFEGCDFPVPAHSEIVLSQIYDSFWKFPRDAGCIAHSNTIKQLLPTQRLRCVLDELTVLASEYCREH